MSNARASCLAYIAGCLTATVACLISIGLETRHQRTVKVGPAIHVSAEVAEHTRRTRAS